ncbi:TPA: MFS transporter, partial [Acinetobacter baumannii]|nr:MFS transporter [Acinetobacter baumannii]
SVLIPFSPNIEIFYLLRGLQGLANGLTIPLLMACALRFLGPEIRLWGLACYALTATFFPNLSAALAAFYLDVIGWKMIFFQTIPFCALSAALVYFGIPQDPLNYSRIKTYDWTGAILAIIGLASLSTMLLHGNHLDWFHSKLICVLALMSAITLPLFLIHEWRYPTPLIKPQMLEIRNFGYAVIALFCFVVIGMSTSTLPLNYLSAVHGYKPTQTMWIGLQIAALQFIYIPIVIKVLNQAWVDSRYVHGFGLLLVMVGCLGASQLDTTWNQDQFYFWHAISCLGQTCVVLSLLMMGTNSVHPTMAIYASPMINTPRAISGVLGVCLLDWVNRVRGEYHSTRLIENTAQHVFQNIQGPVINPLTPPVLSADGTERVSGGLSALNSAIQAQQSVLVISDQYLILAGLTAILFIVMLILPVRTYPPRIALIKLMNSHNSGKSL